MTRNPPLTLEQIAGFMLADLPDPKEGFHIEVSEAPFIKKLKREERDETLDALEQEVELIREWIRTLNVPDAIADHPFYPDLITCRFEEEGEEIDPESPLVQKRNILPFIPRHPDIEAAEKRLATAAEQYIAQIQKSEEELEPEKIERVKRTIKIALMRIMQDNILAFDKQPIIPIPDHQRRREASELPPPSSIRLAAKALISGMQQKPRQGVVLEGISSYEVRNMVRRLQRKQDKEIGKINNKKKTIEDEKEAEREAVRNKICLELLIELKMLPRDLSQQEKEDFVEIEMPTCLSKATSLYEGIVKSLSKAQADFEIGGEQVEVEVVEENKYRNIFELLEYIVNHSRKKQDYRSEDRRKLNEAQAIAKYFFDFVVIRTHDAYRKARAGEQKFRRKFVKNIFTEDDKEETATVHFDKDGNILEEGDKKQCRHKNIGLRHIQISDALEEMKLLRVYFDGIRRKTSTALVKKKNTNPSYTLDKDIFDFLGGRLFVWDITRADYLDPQKGPAIQDGLNFLARKVGQCMGLREVYKDRTQLKPGEFMIKAKIDENDTNGKSKNYPAIKIYGINLEGVPIEFQIVLKDGYQTSKSKGSPNNEERYELEKDLTLCETAFPESTHPEIHKAAAEVRSRLRALTSAWFEVHPEMAAPQA